VARQENKKQAAKQASIQLERERMHRRYDLAKWTVAPLVWIVSSWIPLKGALPIAETLSGEKTTLTVTFSITIAVSLVASAGLIAMFFRARKAEKEVDRLRQVTKGLELDRKEVTAQ
jgi:hypothetical protein